MVHNDEPDALYALGDKANEELASLAENGITGPLKELYEDMDGVAMVDSTEGLLFPGDSTTITVRVSDDYPLVTIASMAVNTNDCFVALNGSYLMDGAVLDTPGLDAGSEENNEMCSSIPGPMCAEVDGNVSSGNGEGFVHVHRGIQGVGDLEGKSADWRNPMMRVSVMESDMK